MGTRKAKKLLGNLQMSTVNKQLEDLAKAITESNLTNRQKVLFLYYLYENVMDEISKSQKTYNILHHTQVNQTVYRIKKINNSNLDIDAEIRKIFRQIVKSELNAGQRMVILYDICESCFKEISDSTDTLSVIGEDNGLSRTKNKIQMIRYYRETMENIIKPFVDFLYSYFSSCVSSYAYTDELEMHYIKRHVWSDDIRSNLTRDLLKKCRGFEFINKFRFMDKQNVDMIQPYITQLEQLATQIRSILYSYFMGLDITPKYKAETIKHYETGYKWSSNATCCLKGRCRGFKIKQDPNKAYGDNY